MKKMLFAVCAVVSLALFSSCGISDKMQQRMSNSLNLALNTAFLSQDDFVAFAPSVELRDVEKGESPWSSVDGYHSNFSCSFTDKDKSVYLVGAVGFDKNGYVIKGDDGKYPIDIFVITVDLKDVPVLQSPYYLPAFGGTVVE